MKAVLLLFAALPLAAAPQGFEAAESIRQQELDPDACYRAREIALQRDELRLFFTEGWIIFAKPVNGRRYTALFVQSDEGGDAEVLLIPPSRGERFSLAKFTGSPTLNEHFGLAVMVFTDSAAEDLMAELTRRGEPRKSPEMGHLLARQWSQTVSNLAGSFIIRLVEQTLSRIPPDRGFFYAAVHGRSLGNFDVLYDPESPQQIHVGRLAYRDNVPFYDTWTNFPARSFRQGARKPPEPPFRTTAIRIEAVLEDNLNLRAVTEATVVPNRDAPVLSFEITQQMKVTAVRVNGEEAELLDRESLRSSLFRTGGGAIFLVVPPQPLAAGRACQVTFEHEGRVIQNAARKVFYVGSRSNWYPRGGFLFAPHDITFTYPDSLQLLFAGDIKEDRREGGQRTTRRVSPQPLRLAGFNLGDYQSFQTARGPLTIEVFANREAENALRRPSDVVVLPPASPFPRRGALNRPPTDVLTLPTSPPDPTARLRTLGTDVAEAFEFFAQRFGPPALSHLLVSPIPGRFGQGFPGLIYLSTLAYIDPGQRPQSARAQDSDLFFSELLHAHEAAHQWWGNVVTTVTSEDDWMMEALANYSAILMLEKRKGPAAAARLLNQYKERLLAKAEDGNTLESAGPIRLGLRLQSSQSPTAWRNIVYEKGTWIIHMLRKRIGDEGFFAMLGEFCRQNRFQAVNSEQLLAAAARQLPKDSYDPALEAFYESWISGTGIPELTLTQKLTGRAPALRLELTLEQSGVDDHFTAVVPVEIQTPGARPQTIWMQTGPDPARASIPLRARPAKVTLDPENAVLAVRK